MQAPRILDCSVVIDRVRVRVQPGGAPPGPGRERERPQPRPGCHRIVVGELRLDTEAALGELEARRLGARVAGALGEELAALQARRAAAILAGRSRGGAIYVPSLCAVLRGAEAIRPEPRAIARALAGALERRSA